MDLMKLLKSFLDQQCLSVGDEEAKFTMPSAATRYDSVASVETEALKIAQSAPIDALQLSGNSYGTDACLRLAESLEQHPELKRALWSDIFTGRLREDIPPALKGLCNAMQTAGVRLVELDLCDNAFGPVGIAAIEDFLRSPSAFSLEILKLNNTGMGIYGAQKLADALRDGLSKSRMLGSPMRIRVFVAGRSRLEDQGSLALAPVFGEMGSLQCLVIPQNGIYPRGVAAWSQAIGRCAAMRFVDLSDNTFTLKGCRPMAQALMVLRNLEVVAFNDCLCKTAGAILLADAIASGSPNLTHLLLDGNSIGKAAIDPLVKCAAKKQSLQKLSLNANSFGTGLDRLKELLENVHKDQCLMTVSDDEGSEEESEEDEEEEVEKEDKEQPEADRNGSSKEEEEPQPECDRPVCFSNDQAFKEALAELERMGAEEAAPAGFSLTVDQLLSRPAQSLAANIQEPDNGEYLTDVFVAISSLITKKNAASTEPAVDRLFDAIFPAVFADPILSESFMNHVAPAIGLLKREDGHDPPANLHGLLRGLTLMVAKRWFPAVHRNAFAFLIKRNPHQLSFAGNTQELAKLLEKLA